MALLVGYHLWLLIVDWFVGRMLVVGIFICFGSLIGPQLLIPGPLFDCQVLSGSVYLCLSLDAPDGCLLLCLVFILLGVNIVCLWWLVRVFSCGSGSRLPVRESGRYGVC